jgi:hypothetical protein
VRRPLFGLLFYVCLQDALWALEANLKLPLEIVDIILPICYTSAIQIRRYEVSRQLNVRLPDWTDEQMQKIIKSTGMTQVQFLIVAIDHFSQSYQKEEFTVKRTTNPQGAAQAAQEDKIVKMPLTGRNWRVNGLSEGANGWVAMISHPDYVESKVIDVLENQEFVIYSQAEYRRMVDDLAGRLVQQ